MMLVIISGNCQRIFHQKYHLIHSMIPTPRLTCYSRLISLGQRYPSVTTSQIRSLSWTKQYVYYRFVFVYKVVIVTQEKQSIQQSYGKSNTLRFKEFISFWLSLFQSETKRRDESVSMQGNKYSQTADNFLVKHLVDLLLILVPVLFTFICFFQHNGLTDWIRLLKY